MLDAALVVPDVRAQCLLEGECQQIPEREVGPELWELLQRPRGRANASRLTVFDSTGWAVEDDAALRLAHRLSVEHGLGTNIVLESISSDPYDPYSPAMGGPGVTATTSPTSSTST